MWWWFLSFLLPDCNRGAIAIRGLFFPHQEVCHPIKKSVMILGVEVDRGVRFDGHIKHIAHKAYNSVSAM